MSGVNIRRITMRCAFISMILILTMLSGCSAGKQQPPSVVPPVTPAQSYEQPEERYRNPGSIFSDADSHSLFTDTRARRVGDIVMVRIVDSMRGTNKADTTSQKDSSNDYSLNSYMSPFSINPLGTGTLKPVTGPGAVFGTNATNSLSASGETKRENVVTATVAARVVRVMPGGMMQIEGARETRINNETQYLVVSGLIRSMDVLPDNSVTSDRIADAHIAYYGKGVVSDKQKSGWITRLLDNVWPF
jgi:flagellar L-ring protein precursor FlgH